MVINPDSKQSESNVPLEQSKPLTKKSMVVNSYIARALHRFSTENSRQILDKKAIEGITQSTFSSKKLGRGSDKDISFYSTQSFTSKADGLLSTPSKILGGPRGPIGDQLRYRHQRQKSKLIKKKLHTTEQKLQHIIETSNALKVLKNNQDEKTSKSKSGRF